MITFRCSNCDTQFVSLREMINHDALCKQGFSFPVFVQETAEKTKEWDHADPADYDLPVDGSGLRGNIFA